MTPSQAAAISIARSVAARLAAEDEETDQAALIAACEVEGIDVNGVLLALVRAWDEASEELETIARRMERLDDRHDRAVNKIANMKSAIASILDAIGKTKWRHPEFSLAVTSAKPGVVVTDPDALPAEFVRVRREPDKVAIGSAIASGATVPGAEMRNGLPSLRIKRT